MRRLTLGVKGLERDDVEARDEGEVTNVGGE